MDELNAKRKSVLSTIQYGLPEIRKALGLSQTDFANLIGKSRQGISLIERGELEMGWETCLAIITIANNRNPKLIASIYGQALEKDLQEILNS